MSNAKFTKGEWVKLDGEPYVYSLNPSALNRWQLTVKGNGVAAKGELEANAHLIAAAPEMYEMLEKLLAPYGREDISDEQIENLLAKARGEA